jgi:Tol biopolymer transport system component
MLCDFLHLSDGIERKVKRCQVRLVGYSGSDLEGIGLKEEEVELWISYFTTTLNRWVIRCATFSTVRESNVFGADGDQLAFGDLSTLFGSAPRAIHLLNLKTHERSTLPGSEGLFSPRWSPDGSHIAAMTRDSASVWLYDVATQKWVELAKLAHLAFPSWSRDSKYIYFHSHTGDNSAFYRVGVGDRKLEQLVSLTNIRRAGTYGWTGLALDDAPFLLREVRTEEIYALDWQGP